MIYRRILLLSLCLLPGSLLWGQEAAVVASAPSTTGTVDVAKLETAIEQMREQWQVPGLAVAIVKDDAVVMSRGFGIRELGDSEPVDGDTLFAIASNSKAFTAAALAILVDEGKLKWDDHVHRYLPWLRLKDPYATADLRVRDLLCHRSGLGTFSGDLLWWGTAYSPREVLERAVHLEPAASFRAEYGYSNLMFLAAGEVISAVSGQSWGEFVTHRILQPLEMQRTITSTRDLLSKGNFATPHKTLLDGSKPIEWMNWDTMAAAGGLISSSNDMAKWLRLQLRQGKLISDEGAEATQLFSTAQSHEMWQAQIALSVSAGYSARYPSTHFRAYGLGWTLSDYLGRKLVGHGGGYDGMYSQVVMVPEENLGVVVLTNSMTGISPAIANTIVDTYLQGEPTEDWSGNMLPRFRQSRVEFQQRIDEAIKKRAEGTEPSRPLEAYTGTYQSELYGDCVIELEDGKLVLKLVPNLDLVADLEHLHYDTFVIRWRKEAAWFDSGTAHFVDNAKGEFVKLELDVPNDDLWFYELDLRRK